jgi:hypothetical protein
MWPRVCEILIAAWLAASPWVLGHASGPPGMWLSDLAAAAVIVVLAAASFTERGRRLHLLELLVAAWLIGFGNFAAPHALPNLQNDILTGLVAPMFAIIPSPVNDTPRPWRVFVVGQ